MEYFIRGGRYASCVHAGGLSCNNLTLPTVVQQESSTDNDIGDSKRSWQQNRIVVDPNIQLMWDSLISTMASIPEVVTAKLGKETRCNFSSLLEYLSR